MRKNQIQQLADLGQSVWIDSLSRRMIESGQLQELIDQGVVGVTSNPTIFDEAISKTADYDDQIRELVAAGRDTAKIYEALVIRDIQDACDILHPVYDRTDGDDGYVSLEVSPLLARQTEATLTEARRLYQTVDRPNLMIKIPGTPEGMPAIEQALAEGININITLLFSRDAYRAVMEAYLKAMERRVEGGQPVGEIASVASFFVSRVDTEVDKRLENVMDDSADSEQAGRARELFGKIAIANARLAYQDFMEVSGQERFEQLSEHGVRVQRPLWASTSTKNPAFPDTLYVDELIGDHTVQTLPLITLEALLDHGKIESHTIATDVEAAERAIHEMESLGIPYDDVTNTLVEEGVDKFAASFNSLMDSLQAKRARLAEELQQARAD